MGTIHILEGVDHLLFLLVLLLIVNGLWPLIKTVTAFTVAHSLTLALATLGPRQHLARADRGGHFAEHRIAGRRGGA